METFVFLQLSLKRSKNKQISKFSFSLSILHMLPEF